MSKNTEIEWTDATFNAWIGCTKVSPACDHCYAEVSTPARALGIAWGPKAERRRTSQATGDSHCVGTCAEPSSNRHTAAAGAYSAQALPMCSTMPLTRSGARICLS